MKITDGMPGTPYRRATDQFDDILNKYNKELVVAAQATGLSVELQMLGLAESFLSSSMTVMTMARPDLQSDEIPLEFFALFRKHAINER